MEDPLLKDYQRKRREENRILEGPIPMEAAYKKVWQEALDEAIFARQKAAEKCILNGVEINP